MNTTLLKKLVRKPQRDSATLTDTELRGVSVYGPKEDTHTREHRLAVCEPDAAHYWVALKGRCFALRDIGIPTTTCMASVESMMLIAVPDARSYGLFGDAPCYVTFKGQNWTGWSKRWSKRTAAAAQK